MIKAPTFLVGAERSGTTLLRLMLSHHPQIAWCNEFEYAVDQLSNYGKFPQLNNYYEWLETHRIFQATNFHIDQTLEYPELVNSFLYQRLTNENKSLVGATVHRHFDRLLHIWPDAKFIHIIRDGRDVARSCVTMGWAGNSWMGVERWIATERLWESLSQKIERNQYIEITYEDLILSPKETLERISQFIGVSYDPVMLSYAEKTTYEKPDPNLVFQWQKKMTAREVQLVESKIAIMLKERCYQISSFPPIQVSYLEQKLLLWQNRWNRLLFRIDRYGLDLVVKDFIARHSGLKSWEKSLTLKMNIIEAMNLK
jgi:hypothetical protein